MRADESFLKNSAAYGFLALKTFILSHLKFKIRGFLNVLFSIFLFLKQTKKFIYLDNKRNLIN